MAPSPSPPRRPRPALALAFAGALALVGVGGAHGGAPEHALERTALCLDADSVAVEAGGAGVAASTDAVLAERLTRGLRAALARADVPVREVADATGRGCAAVRQRLVVERWESVRGMVVGYDLTLEVLPGPGAAPRFFLGADDAFLEAEATAPWLVLLPRFADAAARDLALSWWEDNPLRVGPPRWLPPALGAGLSLLTGAAAALLLRRRRRLPAR